MPKSKTFDPRHADNPQLIAQYLNYALASDTPSVIGRALAVLVRSQNVTALSKEIGLPREGLYKKFRADADPRLSQVRKLFAVLGMRLAVEPIPGASIKLRPKRRSSS
jgi:probable addiction module antidote protein